LAKKDKDKQKEDFLKEIKVDENEPVRKISRDTLAKPRVIRKISGSNKQEEMSPTKALRKNSGSTKQQEEMSPTNGDPSQKSIPVLKRKSKIENGFEIQEVDAANLVEEKRKSKNFSFDSYAQMQANVPIYTSGEYQRMMEQLKT